MRNSAKDSAWLARWGASWGATWATRRSASHVVWAIAWAVMALGCSSYVDRQAASSTYRILLASVEAAERQPDLELARAAMPGGMLQLEAFALAYPEHAGFRRLHADALCQYAIAFVYDDWEDAHLDGRSAEADRIAARLRTLLPRCVDANLALLPPEWREARSKGGVTYRALLATATREQVPALLWIASADALQLALDPMRNLGRVKSLEATLERTAELSPGYREASSELLLGSLVAGRARVFGGDDGAEHFERARTRAGEGALMIEVMFARSVAVARKDPALFESTLRSVLDADVERWPERRLANELARRKARRYLAARDTLLSEVSAAQPSPP